MRLFIGIFRAVVAAFVVVGTRDIWLHGEADGLVYFTNQSNLLLGAVFAWAAIATLGWSAQPPAWLKGAVTVFIVITGLVSYFILAPEAPGQPTVVLGLTHGQIVHQVTPVLAVIDFIFFDPHRRLTMRNAGLWLLYPLAYCIFTTIRGEVIDGVGYPYGFIDVSDLGYLGLLTNVLIYGIGFFVLGLLLVGIDRVLRPAPLLGNVSSTRGRREAIVAGVTDYQFGVRASDL